MSIKHLVAASQLGPAKAATQNNLGLSYFDDENFIDALTCFETAKTTEEISVHD